MQCSGELDDSSLTLHSKSPRRGWDTILGLPFSRPTHSLAELRRANELHRIVLSICKCRTLLSHSALYWATLYPTELICVLHSYSVSYGATLYPTELIYILQSYSASYRVPASCLAFQHHYDLLRILLSTLHPTVLLCILLSYSACSRPTLHPSELRHTQLNCARSIIH